MTRTDPHSPRLDPDGPDWRLSGDWRLARLQDLMHRLETAPPGIAPGARIDAGALTALDTAGALLLLRCLRRAGTAPEAVRLEALRPADQALLELVASRYTPERPPGRREAPWRRLLGRVGNAVADFGAQAQALAGFVGLVLVTLLQLLTRRRRLRLTSTVFHMEQVGFDAVPIVCLLTFLVGAVVAFVGATALRDFGAEIFTVELVSISFLREFGVLLTAILLAGRSGSAFTAQIGSMKSREELDAISALGLDPVELLVVPRLLALLVMLPLLTVLAMLMGIVGGGLVGVLALDITPGMFVARLQEMTEIRHLWVGLSKAPVFAFLIATVGCLEGFKVAGSAESVGRHTTSAVVQSIFLVIVFDALFAMFFMELGV